MKPLPTPSNDNRAPEPREWLIGNMLTTGVAVEEHLTTGLQAMLQANGVSPALREAVGEFVQPLLGFVRQTETEVIAFARENLTAYKVPKRVDFRDALPKTNVGKILRRELRD